MKQRPYSPDELEQIRVLVAASPKNTGGTELARRLNRHPNCVFAKMRDMRRKQQMRREQPSPAIIDDFGISHADLMKDILEGRR